MEMEYSKPLDDFNELSEEREVIETLNVNKFILLNVLTLGLYGIWWMYKSWRFFKEKDKLDIMPAMRAIFAIFFTHSLFEKILKYANSKGFPDTYSSSGLFIGFILLNFMSRLPDPFWLVSIFAFLCLIPPFKALNYAIEQSDDYQVIEQTSFNNRQMVLIVLGAIFWILILVGLFLIVQEL